ncbi:MAG TPA: hypothetical protein VLH94_04490 [Spirochaetia bacterium]|nr:hypothetical protein [Spirochaetia bacterium]
MKKKLVKIQFEHNDVPYIALVNKNVPNAIILPDHTVLHTNCVVLHEKTGRRQRGAERHTKQIFNGIGELVPLEVLHQPGNRKPFTTRFPIVFAEQESSISTNEMPEEA